MASFRVNGKDISPEDLGDILAGSDPCALADLMEVVGIHALGMMSGRTGFHARAAARALREDVTILVGQVAVRACRRSS